jgi:serine/threonine kinase 16
MDQALTSAAETTDDLEAGSSMGASPLPRHTGPLASLWAALRGVAEALLAGCGCRRSVVVGARRMAVVKQIAEGGYSFVFLAREARSGRMYALKQLLCQSGEQRAAARAEIDVHRATAGRPGVAPLLDYAFVKEPDGSGAERVYLLFPFYGHGSLADRLAVRPAPLGAGGAGERRADRRGRGYFTEAESLTLLLGVCEGLGALHSLEPPLAHR